MCECADYYSLDRSLVFAVINTESSFQKDSVSSAGAKGLMQLTDRTAKYVADMLCVEEYDIFDPYTNVWFGCFYLSYLRSKFKVVETVLCAYNAGEGNVVIWLSNSEYSKDGENLISSPYPETENYLKKVKTGQKKYINLYKKIIYN